MRRSPGCAVAGGRKRGRRNEAGHGEYSVKHERGRDPGCGTRRRLGVQVRAGGARGRALAWTVTGGAVARGGGAARRAARTDGRGTMGEAVGVAIGCAIAAQSGQIAQSPCECRWPGGPGGGEGASASLWQRMPAPGSNAANMASCCPAATGAADATDSRFAGHWPPDRAERELDGKCQQRQTKAGTGSATGHIGEHPTPRRCGAKQRSAPPAASLSSEFLYADSNNSCVCRKAWLARLFFPDLLSLYAASWPLFSAICLKLVHTRLSLAPIRGLCRRAVPWPSGCSESAR